MEEWTVKTKLRGGFLIIGQSTIASTAPIVPGLISMEVSPILNEEGKPTGVHDLTAVLQVQETPGEKTPGNMINDRVHDLLAATRSLFALGSGQRVEIMGGSSATMRLSHEPASFRCIIGNAEYAELVSPVPLQQSLLSTAIDPKMLRVIAWWSRGLPPGNPADRLVCLNNSLDMLASSMKLGKPRIDECEKCKHRRESKPGLRQNVLAFLGERGVSREDAREIYDARIALAHGSSRLSIEEERTYEKHCGTLLRVIRDAVANALGIQLPASPAQMFHGPSAFMDVVYTTPPSRQAPAS